MGKTVSKETGGSTMLVLSRKSQESVVVCEAGGADPVLRVTVLAIKGDKVRLGFEADPGIPVHCLEVWQRSRAGGRTAGLAEDPRRRPVLRQGAYSLSSKF